MMVRTVRDNTEHRVNKLTYFSLSNAYLATMPDEVDMLMRAGLYGYVVKDFKRGQQR